MIFLSLHPLQQSIFPHRETLEEGSIAREAAREENRDRDRDLEQEAARVIDRVKFRDQNARDVIRATDLLHLLLLLLLLLNHTNTGIILLHLQENIIREADQDQETVGEKDPDPDLEQDLDLLHQPISGKGNIAITMKMTQVIIVQKHNILTKEDDFLE